MQVDLLRSEDIDPVEERLGEHSPTRALGLIPQTREISQVGDGLGSGGATRGDALRVGLLLVESARRHLEVRRVPIAAVKSKRRLAIPLDPRDRRGIDDRGLGIERGHMLYCAACGRHLIGQQDRYRHNFACEEWLAAKASPRRAFRNAIDHWGKGMSYPADAFEGIVRQALTHVSANAKLSADVEGRLPR